MSDRTKAMDSLIAQDADLIDDRDALTPVYLTGFENGRESERAKIVAWMRDTIFNMRVPEDIPAAIEAKDHLK
jgi:hypothetical protein